MQFFLDNTCQKPTNTVKKKKNSSLTESKLRVKSGLIGVIDHTVGHGKLGLILRWIHRRRRHACGVVERRPHHGRDSGGADGCGGGDRHGCHDQPLLRHDGA